MKIARHEWGSVFTEIGNMGLHALHLMLAEQFTACLILSSRTQMGPWLGKRTLLVKRQAVFQPFVTVHFKQTVKLTVLQLEPH